jgi:hypothetical protein
MRTFSLSVLAIAASLLLFTSFKAEASSQAFDSIVASSPTTSIILSEKLKQQSGLTPEQSRRIMCDRWLRV